MRLFPVFLTSLILLTACSPQKLLKRAEIYLKGSPPVQVMTTRPDLRPEDMDPMRYTPILMQLVEEGFKAEGISVTYLPMQENFEPKKSSQFVLEIGMAMINERIDPSPGTPIEPLATGLMVNMGAGVLSVDKTGKSDFRDFQIAYTLTAENKAQEMAGHETDDINGIALEKAIDELVEQVKEHLMQHMKANRRAL